MFIQRVSKTAAAMSRQQLKGPVPMLVNDFSSRKIDKYPRPLHSKKHGVDILKDSLWNKSLAFSQSERDRLGLRGLIPPAVRSIEDQVDRVLGVLRSLPDNIQKNLYLQDLHNRNETLYHRLLVEHVAEIAPLIYTPTVGDVCKQFGHRYTRARGMYFSSEDRGHMSTMVHNWPHDDVHVIVVTDGSRILGLGDLGVHGMGIPIGKLALYCGAGGIAPHRVLPITLDVGTNNEKLLADCNYVGLKQKRITGDEYYDIVDEFMAAVFSRWPGVVVQFEDFETPKAVPLLAKYRDKYRCFNDDIQGTGSVTLAGLIAAARNAGSSVTDMRVLCAGAGSAGLGVCSQIVDGMVEAGLTREEAMSRFVVCTSKGALGRSDGKYGDPNHKRGLTDLTTPWVNPAISDGATMLDAVKDFKPTVLLGLSTIPGIFTEEMIRTMASQCDKPIIMPMSNPTDKSECTPAQAYEWTNGKAVVATGSPFPSYTLPDGRVLTPSQCNNMYIFPGIGLAASVAGITKITDKMLYKASVACADAMNEQEKAEGRTFANLARIRDVSHAVAVAVINEGLAEKLTTKITARHLAEGIPALVSRKMYFPDYVPLL